jgi:hypothetical protein
VPDVICPVIDSHLELDSKSSCASGHGRIASLSRPTATAMIAAVSNAPTMTGYYWATFVSTLVDASIGALERLRPDRCNNTD